MSLSRAMKKRRRITEDSPYWLSSLHGNKRGRRRRIRRLEPLGKVRKRRRYTRW